MSDGGEQKKNLVRLFVCLTFAFGSYVCALCILFGYGAIWSRLKHEQNHLKLEINEFVTFSNCLQLLTVDSIGTKTI